MSIKEKLMNTAPTTEEAMLVEQHGKSVWLVFFS